MIEELILEGFKSYRDKETISFSQGVNKISGRNAAGKTTILEAILFGLFGEVPGVNKRDLITMGKDSTTVIVRFRSPLTGKKARILRQGSLTTNKKTGELSFRATKNLLEVEGENLTYSRSLDIQEKLKELLGVGKTTFLNVVFARQKAFIDILRPPNKTRMDAILGLTTPAEIREQLRDVKHILEDRGKINEKGTIDERIRNAIQVIKEAVENTERLQERIKEVSGGIDDKKIDLQESQHLVSQSENLLEENNRLEKQSIKLDQLQARREDREDDLQGQIESLEADPDTLQDELERQIESAKKTEERLTRLVDEDLGKQRRRLDSEHARLDHQIKEHQQFQQQGYTKCPKCGQKIDPKLIEKDLALWAIQKEDNEKELISIEGEIKTIQDQAKHSRKKGESARTELTKLVEKQKRIKELTLAIKDLDDQRARLQQKIGKENKEFLQKIEEEENKTFLNLERVKEWLEDRLSMQRKIHQELYAEVREREREISLLEKQISDLEERKKSQSLVLEESQSTLDRIVEYEAKIRVLTAIQERYSLYERELRENTLKLLEYQTYLYFQRLTDQQMYSGCHIDRDRYYLEVQPIGSPRLLPAWRTGGGHESLFALAERLALLRVMEFPYLLILDEPTDAVDSENIPQLLDYIVRSSNEIGQVLLVTHHGHGEEDGVNLVDVSKSGNVSRVSQSELS